MFTARGDRGASDLWLLPIASATPRPSPFIESRFNQTQGGDFSDWYSPGGQTPQVQDAVGTQGAQPTLNVELTRLDVLGYTRIATATPAVTAAAAQASIENVPKAIDLGSDESRRAPSAPPDFVRPMTSAWAALK